MVRIFYALIIVGQGLKILVLLFILLNWDTYELLLPIALAHATISFYGAGLTWSNLQSPTHGIQESWNTAFSHLYLADLALILLFPSWFSL